MNISKRMTVNNENGIFIKLPRSFYKKNVEILVTPLVEEKKIKKITREELKKMIPGSVTESLIGIISSNMTLEDIRNERLKKYENTN
jgi:regulator of PEP synthase PpsR (kinase-PPPase family)